MQAVENNVVSLRAVDGGLARLELGVAAGADAIADPDLATTLAGLARVLIAAAPGARLDSPQAEGAGFDAWIRVSHGHAAPLHIRRVRAFAPAVRARDRGLDLLIVSPPSLDGASPCGAPVDAARMLASQLGCKRLAVATDFRQGATPTERSDEIDYLSVADALHALAAGEPVADMLVVPASAVDTVVAVASGLTGTAALATAHDIGASDLRSSAGVADGRLPTLPGLLVATAELLAFTGRHELARTIADAVCRTLEDGIGTADIDLTHPYGRLVDDDAFAEAVIDRFGETVRSLQPHFARLPGRAGPAQRPAMRLVHGGAVAS